MKRGWLVCLSLAAVACAPTRPLRALLMPPSLIATPTASLGVVFVAQTPTPAPAAAPAAAYESRLPGEPAWGGAAACAGLVNAPIGTGAFQWPTDQHYLSGYDYDPLVHPGLDLAAGQGDSIYAAEAGAVVYAGWNDQGYGELIILDHGDGWHTLYAHLSQINVTCGQGVQRGTVIGLAGSTGHSTGPHLHFEMRSLAGRVNPWFYLP